MKEEYLNAARRALRESAETLARALPATQRRTQRRAQRALRAALKSSLPLLLAALLALAGCCAAPCPEKLASIDQIVAAHNANAASVPRLWARVEMDVTIKPKNAPQFTWRSGYPSSLLIYRRGENPNGPHDFVLVGREMAAIELFRLGSSTAQGFYYFWYKIGDQAGAWYGRLGLAGAPGVRQMPIDPMQLLGILGITPLPAEPGQLPAAVLSMNNTPGDCAYVVSVIDRQPVSNRVLFRREIILPWNKDEAPRPARVNILDGAGRRVMTAALSNYKPIDVSSLDDPPAKSPVMPTDVDIVCNELPGVDAFIQRIHLRISEMTADEQKAEHAEAAKFTPPPGTMPVLVDEALTKPPAGRPTSQPATQPARPAGRPAGKTAKRGEK